ncbi:MULTISPECIES: DNA-binding transcriptional regulator [unclassified Burkholderia]|uniref:DNA-binding transcriptional regulator n=1 Tax=unclassified Burkholderia TaxID=2613784 RepID=UPI000F580825|nr:MULTISPECIES: DNA-binding transcriptional regulator [unclassified Burkholderia]RQR30761.1 DNA-binding transcriptional regulator [Burkholderia sp. Bp9142]RQR45981.1 DNA-binding transcriptional regulator [Burkholderia sp. Bp9140]RQZ21015.1 DNA-binding transcriptional regulator [Burkholderia sp. Bp9031]
MSRYTSVRGLARGLQVLRALNGMENGRATSQQISDATGLHRTTVRRLLETLVEEGCVRRSPSDDSFRLVLGVRSLSEGFTDDEWISTVAPPVMAQLTQRVVWPSDLTTPDGDAMIIRETTHRFSPLSFHRSMVGRRLPMLLTAAGRAYFAACPDAERAGILALLRTNAGDEEQRRLAFDDAYVANLIRQTRADGFGINAGDWGAQKKIGAIAVAISARGHVLGSLNVIYLSKAITPAEAIRRFVPELKVAAREIVTALEGADAG